jgi:hypothetical protein
MSMALSLKFDGPQAAQKNEEAGSDLGTEFGSEPSLTHSGMDDSDLDNFPFAPFEDRLVCFADEIPNGVLEEVIEIEALKEVSKFTNEEKAEAESAWRTELLNLLEDDDEEVQREGLRRLQGAVVELSLTEEGCEVVQRAFQVAHVGEEQKSLARELKKHVLQLSTSWYASEVLQTCLEVMRPADASFIVSELSGYSVATACSEPGHEVLCRVLEYLPSAHTAALVAELMNAAQFLCSSECASKVIMHLIDYSPQEQRRYVCEVLLAHEPFLSRHHSARKVLKRARVTLRQQQ